MADEAQHLVLARLRHDAQRVGLDQRGELVGVAREAEEVVLLLDHFGARQVLGAEAADQLILGVELLAADAVEPAIGFSCRYRRSRAGLPELAHARRVALLGAGADEVVGRCAPRLAQRRENIRVARDELGGRDALALGGLHVLQAVVVGAGEEADVFAAEAMEARQGVGQRYSSAKPMCGLALT